VGDVGLAGYNHPQESKLSELSIRILKEGDEAALIEFLVPRLESSMFLASNMQAVGLVDRGQRLGGTYAAAFDGERIVGVAAHFWNQNCVLQAPTHLEPLIQTAVRESRRPASGFLGPNDQVNQAKEFLGLKQDALRHDEAEGLYHLSLDDLQVPSILSREEIRWRRANGDDLDLLTVWLSAMSVETLDEEDRPSLREGRRKSAERILAAGQTWILEDEGKPVSTSGFNATVTDIGGGIVQVGGVYTPPAFRSRGYARAVVAASLLEARKESAEKAVLFTAESNLPAQKAYAALGFQRVGTYRLTFPHDPISL
jgi:predicted GNAT family acetyltransferase